MKYDPNVHQRRSIRLKGFDYSRGLYFVTMCTHERECVFGKIVEDEILLSEIGEIAREEWLKTQTIRTNVTTDKFVVMPNHLHGIVSLRGRGESQFAPTEFKSPSQTIGAIIRGFKSAVTSRVNRMRRTPGNPVWQRNYFEEIIRNESHLQRVREYIDNNIHNWQTDEENPQNT